MIAVAEHSYCSQASSEHVSTEIALIRSAARRSELLHRKPQAFTSEEQQVIRRGEHALQQLWSAHQGLILRLVATYQTKGYNSRNSDLEQEATLAFFDAVITFDPDKGGKLGTWAYFQIRARLQKITRQTIHDAVARARVMQTAPTFSEPEPILEQGLFERLHSIFNELTEKQRQVASLYLEGLDWAEIALKLQSTADAVRMLWTRAVKRLRLLFLGEEKREKQQREVVESQPVEQPKSFAESEPAEQPKSFVESEPVEQPKDFSKPLPRNLFQRLSKRLRCFGSLLKQASVKPPSLHTAMSVHYDSPDIPQQGQNLTGISPIETYCERGAQTWLLGCLNCDASWRLGSDCCDGIRGSPCENQSRSKATSLAYSLSLQRGIHA